MTEAFTTSSADKQAAADLAHALGISCEDFTSGAADILVRALAKHRHLSSQWTVAVVAAWLRDQDGHGEWREAADAIDAEFLHDGWVDDEALRDSLYAE